MVKIQKIICIQLTLLLCCPYRVVPAQCVSPCDCSAEEANLEAAKTALEEAQIALGVERAELHRLHIAQMVAERLWREQDAKANQKKRQLESLEEYLELRSKMWRDLIEAAEEELSQALQEWERCKDAVEEIEEQIAKKEEKLFYAQEELEDIMSRCGTEGGIAGGMELRRAHILAERIDELTEVISQMSIERARLYDALCIAELNVDAKQKALDDLNEDAERDLAAIREAVEQARLDYEVYARRAEELRRDYLIAQQARKNQEILVQGLEEGIKLKQENVEDAQNAVDKCYANCYS